MHTLIIRVKRYSETRVNAKLESWMFKHHSVIRSPILDSPGYAYLLGK